MAELLHCPFCGGEPSRVYEEYEGYYIQCQHCKVRTRAFALEDITEEAWNRRSDVNCKI